MALGLVVCATDGDNVPLVRPEEAELAVAYVPAVDSLLGASVGGALCWPGVSGGSHPVPFGGHGAATACVSGSADVADEYHFWKFQ